MLLMQAMIALNAVMKSSPDNSSANVSVTTRSEVQEREAKYRGGKTVGHDATTDPQGQ